MIILFCLYIRTLDLMNVLKSDLIPVLLFADRLFLPSVLVLNYCGISKAGDKSDIATFCAHVVELDLSYNQLNDWGEVGSLTHLEIKKIVV